MANRNPLSRAHKKRSVISNLTVTVPANGTETQNGTDFQEAINAASYGDTIVLAPGGIYQGTFNFPTKSGGTGTDADFITITTSNQIGLPSPGRRVAPATHASAMPILRGIGYPAIQINEAGARHWKFVGLEVTNDTVNLSAFLIIAQGSHLVFDRMFIHNPEVTANDLHPEVTENVATRGIAVGGSYIQVTNNWIGSFGGYYPGTSTRTDSYGVLVQFSDHVNIQNNQIEAFFNNIFITGGSVDATKTGTISSATQTGGVMSNVTGLVPGSIMAIEIPDGTHGCVVDGNNPVCWMAVEIDTVVGSTVTFHAYGGGGLDVDPVEGGHVQWDGIQITDTTVLQNTLYKNPYWQATFSGGAKGFIETKCSVGGIYRGNIFAGGCSAAMLFEVAQAFSNSGGPWTTISDQLYEHNLHLGDTNGVFVPLGGAEPGGSFPFASCVPGHDIIIQNNLWANVLTPCGTADVSGFAQTAHGHDVTWQNNTIRNANHISPWFNSGGAGRGQTNETVINNIFNYGDHGFNYNSTNGYADGWPPSGIIETKNIVIVDSTQVSNDPAVTLPNSYRVASNAAVGFLDYATGDAGGDYHGYTLSSSSAYAGGGSDLADPGVNLTALDAQLGTDNLAWLVANGYS